MVFVQQIGLNQRCKKGMFLSRLIDINPSALICKKSKYPRAYQPQIVNIVRNGMAYQLLCSLGGPIAALQCHPRSMATSDIKIPESVNVGRNASRSGQRRPEPGPPRRAADELPRLWEMRFHERIFRWGTNLIS